MAKGLGRGGVGWRAAASLGLAVLACSASPASPPSIVLIVLDTARADGVSAYGRVEGTTPTVDRLASEGLLFARAYAQAPWTLPSHATLLTGLLPSEHRISWHRTRVPDQVRTLAERLHERGYDTFAAVENAWLTDTFNLNQGFSQFAFSNPREPSVEFRVERWFESRSSERPYFLFVNVVDPHAPYLVRSTNRFVPSDVTPRIARAISQDPGDYMCGAPARPSDLAILERLYLGEIAAADARVARILEILERSGQLGNAITVVTSDHGEHFGEASLVSHQFSVRDALLRVPLVVHGLPGIEPSVIETPVQLADVVPSVLEWVGAEVPSELAGRPLPLRAGASPPERPIVAAYSDPGEGPMRNDPGVAALLNPGDEDARRHCSAEWPVYGSMRALMRYPFKLIWFADYPPELYDLSRDPREERNLVAAHPEIALQLAAELGEIVARRGPVDDDAQRHPATLDGVREQLEALGYLSASPPELESN